MIWAALILILISLLLWWTWKRPDTSSDWDSGVSLMDWFDFL